MQGENTPLCIIIKINTREKFLWIFVSDILGQSCPYIALAPLKWPVIYWSCCCRSVNNNTEVVLLIYFAHISYIWHSLIRAILLGWHIWNHKSHIICIKTLSTKRHIEINLPVDSFYLRNSWSSNLFCLVISLTLSF